MTGPGMIDYFFILLISVVVLLVVQIISLIRVRFLIRDLRKLLKGLGLLFGVSSQAQSTSGLKKNCKNCKFRKSFVDIRESAEPGKFYYRCALDEKPINLEYSCKRFQAESFFHDQSHK
jgi:hypothetical protein